LRIPMSPRLGFLFAAVLTACDTGVTTSGYAGGASATVRLVNAAAVILDLASSGSVAPGNGALAFGSSSICTPTAAGASDLTVRTSGTATALPGFSPALAAANRYLVVAYTANGVTQFITFSTSAFTPGSGKSGLKVVDAAPGTGNFDVYATPPDSALGLPSATNLSYGSSTSFFNVDPGTVSVRLTTSGTQTVAFNAGSQTIAAGRNYVLVIGPPASGTSEYRSILVPGCP
jgi:hypothetical protein